MLRNPLNFKWPVVLLLAACFSTAAAADELKVGVMTGLSGAYASLGEDCRSGYLTARHAAAEREQGRESPVQIKILWGDHQGDPKTGISEFRRFTGIEKVVALVSDRSQVNMALNPLSKEHKIPLFGVTAAGRFVLENPYAMRFWPSTRFEARALAEKARNVQAGSAALINLEDEYTLSVRDTFREEYSRLGGPYRV